MLVIEHISNKSWIPLYETFDQDTLVGVVYIILRLHNSHISLVCSPDLVFSLSSIIFKELSLIPVKLADVLENLLKFWNNPTRSKPHKRICVIKAFDRITPVDSPSDDVYILDIIYKLRFHRKTQLPVISAN